MRKKIGFTLVELLVAVTISAVILLSLYSVLHTGIISYNRIDSASGVYQAARIIFARMEIDLKNSIIYSANNSGFKGTNNALEFFSIIDYFQGGNVSTNICRIKYELLDNNTLERICLKGLDAIGKELEAVGDELSSQVKSISFYYAYPINIPNKDKLPYEWQDFWPKNYGNQNQAQLLPLAVRINLSLAQKDKQQKEINVMEFNKTISLPLNNQATP